MLLEKGKADPNLKDREDVTPFLLACREADVISLEALLEHGACLMIRDNHGRNAIDFAAQSGDFEIITKVGTRVNTNITIARDTYDRNTLHYLWERFPAEDSVEYLLKEGVGANDLDHEGYSPMMTMVKSMNLIYAQDAIRFTQHLIQAGAEISIRCPQTGLGLHHININDVEFDLDLMKYLASLGVRFHDKDRKWKTLLHHSAKSG